MLFIKSYLLSGKSTCYTLLNVSTSINQAITGTVLLGSLGESIHSLNDQNRIYS